jgi:hypothetical protein
MAKIVPVEKQKKRVPDFYLFKLLRRMPVAKDGEVLRVGTVSIPSESTILWAYHDAVYDAEGKTIQEEKPFTLEEEAPENWDNYQVRRTRFIPSMQSIFVDEQKGIKEREDGQRHSILDNSKIRERLVFERNELRVKNTEKNLYFFLFCNGQSARMHPNAKQFTSRDAEFELIDFGYQDKLKIEKGQKRERAYEIAHTARVEEMIPHAKFLGIPLTDSSNVDRDVDAIRTDYKDFALSNTELFINSFSDPKTKMLYIIKILFENQLLLVENGSCYWSKTKGFICQMPNDRDMYTFLAEFSLTDDGREFSNNMKSSYQDVRNRNKNSVSFV